MIPSKTVVITEYQSNYAREIADLYHFSVHAIHDAIYTAEQKEAWAPTPPDYKFWQKRLDKKQPFLAFLGEDLVGFMELEHDGHIDCSYTHPKFQRLGVASALYGYLETQAKKRGINRLYVEASHVAKPFFEKLGFPVVLF